MSGKSGTMLSQPSMDEILATLRQHRDEFRTQYAMRSLGVFGSYVRGEASVDSDLDLTPPRTYVDYLRDIV
jgi:predicted nucleotidyltransferase